MSALTLSLSGSPVEEFAERLSDIGLRFSLVHISNIYPIHSTQYKQFKHIPNTQYTVHTVHTYTRHNLHHLFINIVCMFSTKCWGGCRKKRKVPRRSSFGILPLLCAAACRLYCDYMYTNNLIAIITTTIIIPAINTIFFFIIIWVYSPDPLTGTEWKTATASH